MYKIGRKNCEEVHTDEEFCEDLEEVVLTLLRWMESIRGNSSAYKERYPKISWRASVELVGEVFSILYAVQSHVKSGNCSNVALCAAHLDSDGTPIPCQFLKYGFDCVCQEKRQMLRKPLNMKQRKEREAMQEALSKGKK